MILSQRNNSIKRTFAVGWADWLGRTAESMMQFGKAVRRYCHVSVQYVQPLTVRPHLYMNAAAPLYQAIAMALGRAPPPPTAGGPGPPS